MSNDSNVTSFSSPYTGVEQAVILVVMSLISLGSILGNVIVFVAYFKVKKLQRATNYFILSLAAADLFVGMIVVNIYTMYMLLGYWPLNDIACLAWLCADYWVFQASVFGVLMIAMDRYFSIRYPHKYRHRRSDGNVKVAIVVMWLFSFTLWVPLIVSYAFAEETEVHQCHIASAQNVYATALASVCAYVIPVVVIICLAVHSFHLLLRMKQPNKSILFTRELSAADSSMIDKSFTDSNEYDTTQETKQPGSPAPITFKIKTRNGSIKQDSKQTSLIVKSKDSQTIPITLDVKKVCNAYRNLDDFQRIATFNIIIAVAFVVTVFPYGLISIVKAFCTNCVSSQWWHFAYIMCYINSLLNPLCYAFGNKNFNRAFKLILCTSRKQDQEHSKTSSMKEKIDDHRVCQNGCKL